MAVALYKSYKHSRRVYGRLFVFYVVEHIIIYPLRAHLIILPSPLSYQGNTNDNCRRTRYNDYRQSVASRRLLS